MPHRALALLLLLAACTIDPAGDPHPGDAKRLAGSWDLVIHREGNPDLFGQVRLTPSTGASVPVRLRGATLDGAFSLTGAAWLTAQPVDSTASGYVDADGSVVVYLRLQGGCSNCGNIGLAGKLTGDSIAGHWAQEFSSSPPQGSFMMRRTSGLKP